MQYIVREKDFFNLHDLVAPGNKIPNLVSE